MARRDLAMILALCLLARGICYPHSHMQKRATEAEEQNSEISVNTAEQSLNAEKSVAINEIVPPAPVPNDFDDDDDDDDDFDFEPSSSQGGSNIFSLLQLAGAILPSSSGSNVLLRNIIRQLLKLNKPFAIRRQFMDDNEIEIDYIDLKPPSPRPPFLKQEDTSNVSNSESESNESGDNAAEESMENQNGNNSKENTDTNDASVDDNDSDYDSDEPPGGGDGQGGGILGLLAGLSGGEDGQSDLGSLLATVSGIVANLSGDGIDLNALIASGLGLFVGLLSEGEENPGAVIASYLLTSLESITGGGSKNNGAFFGTFLSKLVKGTSAADNSGESSEENGTKMKMADSSGFFISLLMGLLGEMSKGSSGGSHPW